MQRPGHGYDAGCDIVRIADFTKEFNQAKVAAEARLVELGSATAPVVICHAFDSFGAKAFCQQSRLHRAVTDHAGVVRIAP